MKGDETEALMQQGLGHLGHWPCPDNDMPPYAPGVEAAIATVSTSNDAGLTVMSA